MTEQQLIYIAEFGSIDEANKAMAELRTKFDPTYVWCEDCDGVVVKEADCCLNELEKTKEK